MTEITVQKTIATLEVTTPTAPVINVSTGQDVLLVDKPDFAYCSAYDTTEQTASSSSSTYQVGVNTTDVAYQITNSDGTFTFSKSGTYLVTFSVQFNNANNQIIDTNLFLKKNNQLLANSSSYTSVSNRHGSVNGSAITTVNFLLQFVAGDTLQIWWHSTNSECTIHTVTATTTPEMPQSPGIIITIAQVS